MNQQRSTVHCAAGKRSAPWLFHQHCRKRPLSSVVTRPRIRNSRSLHAPGMLKSWCLNWICHIGTAWNITFKASWQFMAHGMAGKVIASISNSILCILHLKLCRSCPLPSRSFTRTLPCCNMATYATRPATKRRCKSWHSKRLDMYIFLK